MIRIKKNSENRCSFTLTERSFSNNDYDLELYSNDNRNDKNLILKRKDDLSINLERYNEWIIEENDVEDISNNIISLKIGTYDYRVFLDEILIESGKCVVFDDKEEPTVYKNNTKENYTYGE